MIMKNAKMLAENGTVNIEYQKWINDPITELVIAAVMETVMAESAQQMQLVGTQGVSIEVNALQNARMKGICECLVRMVSFAKAQAQEMPPEDYEEPKLEVVQGKKQ